MGRPNGCECFCGEDVDILPSSVASDPSHAVSSVPSLIDTACFNCGSMPIQYNVPVTGFSDGLEGECANWNRTWLIEKEPDPVVVGQSPPCIWHNGAAGSGGEVIGSYRYSVQLWRPDPFLVSFRNIARLELKRFYTNRPGHQFWRYEIDLATETFTCLGANVFSKVEVQFDGDAHCLGAPATLTAIPA